MWISIYFEPGQRGKMCLMGCVSQSRWNFRSSVFLRCIFTNKFPSHANMQRCPPTKLYVNDIAHLWVVKFFALDISSWSVFVFFTRRRRRSFNWFFCSNQFLTPENGIRDRDERHWVQFPNRKSFVVKTVFKSLSTVALIESHLLAVKL